MKNESEGKQPTVWICVHLSIYISIGLIVSSPRITYLHLNNFHAFEILVTSNISVYQSIYPSFTLKMNDKLILIIQFRNEFFFFASSCKPLRNWLLYRYFPDYRGNANWQFCALVAMLDVELFYLTTSDTQLPGGILNSLIKRSLTCIFWQAGIETWLMNVSRLPDVCMQLLQQSYSKKQTKKNAHTEPKPVFKID